MGVFLEEYTWCHPYKLSEMMATLFTEKYVASKAYGKLSLVIANIWNILLTYSLRKIKSPLPIRIGRIDFLNFPTMLSPRINSAQALKA